MTFAEIFTGIGMGLAGILTGLLLVLALYLGSRNTRGVYNPVGPTWVPPRFVPADDEPDTNIDGSAMINGTDIHGNAYGVTSGDLLDDEITWTDTGALNDPFGNDFDSGVYGGFDDWG